jgi:hypothetical protein
MAQVTVNITKFIPRAVDDTDLDGIDDLWEWENLLDMYDASDRNEDPDSDGYTNYEEYLGSDKRAPPISDDDTNPWDPTDKPKPARVISDDVVKEAPFEVWIFIMVLIAAIIVALLIILIGYLRIHREEESDKREEAEEEAMLATPQLDIPTMPANIPMVDPSVPTLPSADGGDDQQSALPPMAEQYPEQPQPMDMGQAQPEGQPMYQEQNAAAENPMYQGQQ